MPSRPLRALNGDLATRVTPSRVHRPVQSAEVRAKPAKFELSTMVMQQQRVFRVFAAVDSTLLAIDGREFISGHSWSAVASTRFAPVRMAAAAATATAPLASGRWPRRSTGALIRFRWAPNDVTMNCVTSVAVGQLGAGSSRGPSLGHFRFMHSGYSFGFRRQTARQ